MLQLNTKKVPSSRSFTQFSSIHIQIVITIPNKITHFTHSITSTTNRPFSLHEKWNKAYQYNENTMRLQTELTVIVIHNNNLQNTKRIAIPKTVLSFALFVLNGPRNKKNLLPVHPINCPKKMCIQSKSNFY